MQNKLSKKHTKQLAKRFMHFGKFRTPNPNKPPSWSLNVVKMNKLVDARQMLIITRIERNLL